MIWALAALFVGFFLLGGAFSFARQPDKPRLLVLILALAGALSVAVGLWRIFNS